MFPFYYIDCNGYLWVPCRCGNPTGTTGSSGTTAPETLPGEVQVLAEE